jgi:hypothetical protein
MNGPWQEVSRMPDTVLDVQKVHTDWVVLLEDERLMIIDEESKRVYIDIKNMGQPNRLDLSEACFLDDSESGDLITLSRRPQYSTYKPHVLVTEHSEQNRHLAIFDTRDRRMVFHERMWDANPIIDGLLERPFLGSTVSPKCETVFRTIAPTCCTESPIILEIYLDRWSDQEPCRLLYIAHEILSDQMLNYQYAFNDLQILLNRFLVIERQALYDSGETEEFIFFERSVNILADLTTGAMVNLTLSVSIYDTDGFGESSNVSVSLSAYCSELCKSRLRNGLEKRPHSDFFVTDMAMQHEYRPDFESKRPICCFIGGSHGIIYVADLILWRTIPSVYIATMMVENITFDLLQYNSQHHILLARGTKMNGRSRWYLFNMSGIVQRMLALASIDNRDEDMFPTGESIPQIRNRSRADLINYLVVASSVFDFGPNVCRCFLDSGCTTVRVAKPHSYQTITYAKGSVIDKKIRIMKSALRHHTPTCLISLMLTEEILLEILVLVVQNAVPNDRWDQLR